MNLRAINLSNFSLDSLAQVMIRSYSQENLKPFEFKPEFIIQRFIIKEINYFPFQGLYSSFMKEIQPPVKHQSSYYLVFNDLQCFFQVNDV